MSFYFRTYINNTLKRILRQYLKQNKKQNFSFDVKALVKSAVIMYNEIVCVHAILFSGGY